MDGRWIAGATLCATSRSSTMLAHGDVVGRDAAKPGQQMVGADKLPAVQPPGESDEQQGCLVLGRGEEVMRHGHALFLLAWSRCPAGSAHAMPQ
jgi:hypothetical protein